RDLHSFPTRRSSDLVGPIVIISSVGPTVIISSRRILKIVLPWPLRFPLLVFVGEIWSSLILLLLLNTEILIPLIVRAILFFKTSDRKSTRLNSSHVA